MRKCLLLFLLLLSGWNLPALADSSQIHSIRLKNGAVEQFRFRESVNENKERELTVSLEELHGMAPTTEHALLYARDIDSTGTYSAWFYRNEKGVFVSEKRNPIRADGFDVASEIIQDKLASHERWFASIVLSAVMSKVTITGYYQLKNSNNLEHLLLDEADLNLRLQETPESQRNGDPEYEYLKNLHLATLQEIQKALRSKNFEHTSEHVVEDLVLLVVGGKLFQVGGALTAGIISKLGETGVGQFIARGIQITIEDIDDRLANLAQQPFVRSITQPFGEAGAQVSLRARLLTMPVPAQLRISLAALTSRSRVAQMILEKGQFALATSLRGLKEQAFYIALSQGLQIKAEVSDRPKDLYDPNPIIMAKKLASDKDFKQDFIYMTDETVGTTIITSALIKRGYMTSMFACAVFSLADSAFVNWFVKHQTDLKRATFDTGWEVGIGNTQTFVDLKAMDLFNSLSGRINDPKLKLLGYALVWAERTGDQYGGYLAYGKASEAYDKFAKNEEAAAERKASAKVIPIYGEVADRSGN